MHGPPVLLLVRTGQPLSTRTPSPIRLGVRRWHLSTLNALGNIEASGMEELVRSRGTSHHLESSHRRVAEADRAKESWCRVVDPFGQAAGQVLLQPDPFLNELTSMFERSTEKGSIWVTLKRSSMKCKATRNKMETSGQPIEYRCLVRATDGKKTISTSLSAKEYQKFQASYATVLKAHMNALKKRERKDRKKTVEPEKKQDSSKSNSSKKRSLSTLKPSK
ncbi:hypothetical protein ZIOFF_025651 [Zingiber officinale]|uniref:Signal recognition particle 14 kDa protein n=1 Tax=Zingiber officinale TaxID=94328 RepID=A0A8J5HC33_ZINOF|nr:hypothetical protein ZIOFF_025651 [Zingiber officinale]